MKKIFGIGILMIFGLSATNICAQAAGSLDTSFGTNGRTTTALTQTATLNDLTVQADGKVIAVGTTFGNGPNGTVIPGVTGFVARFNTNGTLDTTFDLNGYNNDQFLSNALTVVVQADGKIVVGGTGSSLTTGQGLGAARFNTDGSLDTTFNGIGKNAVAVGTNAMGAGVSVQADGKVVVVGSGIVNNSRDFALVRYNVDGTLDTTFGSNGRQATNISGEDTANRSAIQADGKILVSGTATDPLSGALIAVIARYNTDGTLDSTFGTNGIVQNSGPDNYSAFRLFPQPDGKIIATGTFYYNNSARAIVRYNSNGTLDTAFQQSGVGASDLKVKPDGKILIAGGTVFGGQNGFGLARFNADGTLDTTFGTNGTTSAEFSTGNTFASRAVFTPDGKVVAGGTVNSGLFEIILARYFGESGARRTAMDFDGNGIADIAVFRPSNATWYTSTNPANNFGAVQFGAASDTLVPADYDGDGKTDIAVFRPSNGIWYLNRSTAGFTGIQFGTAEDIPMPADFDGDGKADLAVFRPSSGTWYLQRSQLGFTGVQFGANGDKPVAADYDGDGRADLAVFRQGIWYLNRSTAGFTGIQFGLADDKLVPADYDADGKADLAVFRSGTWYLNRSTAGFTGIQFGLGTDSPTPADYDGDGKTDIAVWRSGNWYLNNSTQGFTAIQFGIAADTPVPNVYVRSGN